MPIILVALSFFYPCFLHLLNNISLSYSIFYMGSIMTVTYSVMYLCFNGLCCAFFYIRALMSHLLMFGLTVRLISLVGFLGFLMLRIASKIFIYLHKQLKI